MASITIEKLIDCYLNVYIPAKEIKGIDVALANCKTLISYFGNMPFDEIKVLHIVQYVTDRKKQVGLGTIRREMSVFRSILNVGILYELIPKYNGNGDYSSEYNRTKLLMTHISDHRPPQQKRKIRPTLQITEKIKLGLDKAMSDLVQGAILTCYRKSELLSLTKRDVDFTAKEIRLDETKNGEGRNTPMYGQLFNFMKKLVSKNCNTDTDPVFIESDGRPLVKTNTYRRWRTACINAGYVDDNGKALYNFHDLRKLSARYLIETIGLTPEQVQDYFGGWKDPDVFQDIYNLRGYDTFLNDKNKIIDL